MSHENINNMVRGGQTLDHVIGMAKQVISKVFNISFYAFLTVFIVYYYFFVNEPVYTKNYVNYVMASYVADWKESPNKTSLYFTNFPDYKMIRSGSICNDREVINRKEIFTHHLSIASIIAAVISVIIFLFSFGVINRYGKGIKENKYVRGSQVGDIDDVERSISDLVKRDRFLSYGSIILSKLKVPFQWEPQHFSLVGGSGTGKSVIYSYFISAIRKSGKRAVIHDRSGTYVERFYNPKTDIILNPFDARSHSWSLFNECSTSYHFEHVSEVLFPESKGDPFWYLAPRLVFTALAIQESESDKPSTKGLVNSVMRCTLQEMIDICKGTDAMTILDKDGLKVAQTIRSIIATNIKHFRVFDDAVNNTISIRKWLQDDSNSGFIFITSEKDKDVILKPIITLWIDISVATILSMTENLDRRIWFLLDELQALGQLVSLPPALAESRKYGGCFVLGFQGYSQACKIYTKEGVEGLMDCISTFIFTRCNGADTSEWAEKQLGKAENIESNQNLSYGQMDVRDSQGFNQQRQNRAAILASEIQNLPDLGAFIRFGRGVPIAKVQFEYVNYKKHHVGILSNDLYKENVSPFKGDSEVEDADLGDFDDADSSMDSVTKEPENKQSIYSNFDHFGVDGDDVNTFNNDTNTVNENIKYDDEFDGLGGFDIGDDR